MAGKEDLLGLSLSLNFPQNTPNPHPLNLMSSSTHSSSPSPNPQNPWNEVFTSLGMYYYILQIRSFSPFFILHGLINLPDLLKTILIRLKFNNCF